MARLDVRSVAAIVGAAVCCALLLSGNTETASAANVTAASRQAVDSPGTNLLLNPGAQTGAFSAQGWDAVTIPGWQIISGLPTVVRYGTRNFPRVTGKGPATRGGQLFAGGAGGTARLEQVVRLDAAGGRLLPGGTQFRLSAWLGGSRTSSGLVTATFLTKTGRVLGRRVLGPVGERSAEVFRPRAAAGLLPRGTASVRITLQLATSLTNINGPYAPYQGYDYGVADDLRFSVSAPVRAARLTPPVPRVPRYRHVFLFYFENQDFSSIIGNAAQAPFFNSLLRRASLLSDFFAEEHPSDGNYLALAGGSTFGVPLDDPAEENPLYTIRARNIGDLVTATRQTWKAYLQSADGPCDDTVHGYYWDDDLPMMYFADVRDRPAYCSAHVVPLQELRSDLASAATTPAFAWISPDDCADMEGCGIRAGDRFLAIELGEIMRSPAWRTQRSLAIITFDEDAEDHQKPAQRVPTIILASSGVRAGYVSHVRYTHYSLLRTIEAALGLGTLTANDRYAQPVNDVFAVHGAVRASVRRAPARRTAAPLAKARQAKARRAKARRADARQAGARQAGARQAAGAGQVRAHGDAVDRAGAYGEQSPAQSRHATAFVVNSGSNSVTPIDLVTRRAGKPIGVGLDPQAIAITPDGKTAYVVNSESGTVTPITVATRRAGRPIKVGRDPQAIAITPDGKTAFVVNTRSATVTTIELATRRIGAVIRVGSYPTKIAIAPDGRTAFVLNWGGGSVTPIRVSARGSWQAGRQIEVGSYPEAIAINPDGATAYIACYGSNTVTPVSIAIGRAGWPVAVGQAPDALAVTPDGRTVYVVGGDSQTVTPISAAAWRAGRSIAVGYSPNAIAIAGATAYVVNTISGTVTPISTATGRAGRAIGVGIYSYPTAMTMYGDTAVVVGTYGGQVILVSTRTRRAVATLTVGSYPVAVAVAA
jgi:YVTN family beta-propeller protein